MEFVVSTFEAELQIRFNSEPDRPWYFLSGPRPSDKSQPGTSLRYEGKKFIWEIASAYEDTEGTVIVESEEVDIEIGEWFILKVEFETNNHRGEIYLDGETVTGGQRQEGDLYFSMAPLTGIGWNGSTGDYSVYYLSYDIDGKKGTYSLSEKSVHAVTTDRITPSDALEEFDLQWSSGKWITTHLPD